MGRIVRLQDYETCSRTAFCARCANTGTASARAGRSRRGRMSIRGHRAHAGLRVHLGTHRAGAGRLRLAGRHLIDLMGMEVRGMPVCAFLNTSSRAAVLGRAGKRVQGAPDGAADAAGQARLWPPAAERPKCCCCRFGRIWADVTAPWAAWWRRATPASRRAGSTFWRMRSCRSSKAARRSSPRPRPSALPKDAPISSRRGRADKTRSGKSPCAVSPRAETPEERRALFRSSARQPDA